MSRVRWHDSGTRLYETGISSITLFLINDDGSYRNGVVWNGITSISESPSGSEPQKIYSDDNQYLSLRGSEKLDMTIEAYSYPDAFNECLGNTDVIPGLSFGGVSEKRAFGIVYKTIIGNEVSLNEYGRKIHIVFNSFASDSEKAYSTINDSPEAITFQWELTTNEQQLIGYKPFAKMTIDSARCNPAMLESLERLLFGTKSTRATLYDVNRLMAFILTEHGGLKVLSNEVANTNEIESVILNDDISIVEILDQNDANSNAYLLNDVEETSEITN